jgi:hypothetical protein
MAEQSATALATQQANHFSLASNGNEFLLAFGTSRLTMASAAAGAAPQHHVEWVAALSISPMAAVQLAEMLRINIVAYEKKFGKIPADPNFKLTSR